MLKEITYLDPETRKQIDEAAADTASIAERYKPGEFRTKQNKIVGDCPGCAAKDGLEIVASGSKKGVFKCFHCDEVKGKGGAALLQSAYKIEWKQAYAVLADMLHIHIPEQGEQALHNRVQGTSKKVTFRDLQLKQAGIPNSAQTYLRKAGEGKWVEENRYTHGTVLGDGKYTTNGDDLVLHYIGLDNQPIFYKPEKAAKEQPLMRVRYQHPDAHRDRDNKPVKYRSPRNSGSHLWLPKHIIECYAKGVEIETLYISEGEKKADKMCICGIPTVGIMGIHNLALDGNMPRDFELLISKCAIKNVVLVFDADWQDISVTAGKSADARPATFLRAAQKYREYFYGFRNSGHDLGIFLAAGKDANYKGMDDLLSHLEVSGLENTLADDLSRAMVDAKGDGLHITMYKVHPLRMSDYQLKQLWGLETPHEFIKRHVAKLKEVGEFKIGKLLYFYDKDDKDAQEIDRFKLAQQILPEEQFWEDCSYFTQAGRRVVDYRFDYDRIRAFLFNRGIGLYEFVPGQFRTVRKDGKFVEEVTHTQIQRYVADFADTLKDREVVKMILRGNTQYLGPNNLNYMYLHNPEWIQPRQDHQIIVFRNCFWRITPEGIEQRPHSELPGAVWHSKVIPFDANYLGAPMLKVAHSDEGWTIKEHPKAKDCEMYNYIVATSNFAWQKYSELRRINGKMTWVETTDAADVLTDEDKKNMRMHIATKMLGWGYKLRDHRDKSNMRAIVCMDGLESQVGKSEGGSGKSIYAAATRHVQPIFMVDGKTADLKNDRFLYHGVDERTAEIIFDDVNVRFDFELLFSQITEAIRVKPFQGAPITIPAPVFTITTNHAIRGDSTSFRRRQYLLAFSNYFNEHRTPRHVFGHTLFEDWNAEQWNLYYNLMATSIQVYMQHADLSKYGLESGDINRRKLRQAIGEDFLEFADLYWTDGPMLNRVVLKERIMDDYLVKYPSHRKFMDVRFIKEKAALYAKYAGLEYNALAKNPNDPRIKANGQEFICLSDANLDAKAAMADKVYIGTPIEPG